MADQQSGSSTSAFVSSLIFNLIIFAIFVGVFIALRNRYTGVYRPRAENKMLPEHLKAPPLERSAFGWLPDLLTRPKKFIIEQAGIDGYFFLRYLKLWSTIGVCSGLILWPILFAINATGGGGKSGFDIISYSNNTHKWRVFANLFCSWFFFGFVVYTIYSELVYYTSFRHNLQCTPFYSSLPSTKVLLIDNVNEDILNEESLRKLFPAAQRVVISRDTTETGEKWEKRNKLIGKIEGAIITVISKCLKSKSKIDKKISKGKDVEIPTPPNEVSSYLKESKLPKYKMKPIIGESKRVFDEGIDELKELNVQLKDDQAKIKDIPENFDKTGSVFLEFLSQLELQRAYQAIDYAPQFRTSRKFQSFFPQEVIWKNVGTGFIQRKSKKTGAITFLTLMIIFWAIPVAVVGCISNINYLTEKVHFLRFINNMPSSLMGIITGILPSVMLSILMSLVPPIIKWMGKISGCLTLQELDFWTQQWYFAFQVIQVFIVTTATSAASSVVTSIIDDPSSALSMLSQYLPPASNFYICYMLLQGLSISSGLLAQLVGLILSFVLGRFLDKTPRQKWNREVSLAAPSWGTMYGSFGLFTVIMLCYAIIAPIIIAFTSIAFMLIYIAQLYTFVYVSGHTVDNRGRNYPLALFEVFVGVYLGEICLIGLFVMQKNWACVVLEAIWLALTVCAHLYFRYLFEPLLDTVPVGAIDGVYPVEDLGKGQLKEVGDQYFVNGDGTTSNSKMQKTAGVDASSSESYGGTYRSDDFSGALEKKPTMSTRADNTLYDTPLEGNITNREDPEMAYEKQKKLNDHEYSGLASKFGEFAGGSGYEKSWSDSLTRYLKPKSFTRFANYRAHMPDYWLVPINKNLVETVIYQPPEIIDDKEHVLWIAKDKLGLSDEIMQLCGKYDVKCSDEDAVFNEKGKVELTENSYPPDFKSSIMY